MDKYYFPHIHPNDLPTNYGGAIILAKLGLKTDPNFESNWSKCSGINRLLYQRPEPTAENDAFAHAAFMQELVQILQSKYGAAWQTGSIVLNIEYNLNLTWIQTWVDQIIAKIKPSFKPLLYVSPTRWQALQKGNNAQFVSENILLKADLIVSHWSSLPQKPLYLSTIHWWEYESGHVFYADNGKFPSQTVPVDSGGETPPADPEGGNNQTPPISDGSKPIMVIYIYGSSFKIETNDDVRKIYDGEVVNTDKTLKI